MRVSKHYLAILPYLYLEENACSVNSFLILFFLGLASESLSPPLDLSHWPSFPLPFTPIKKNNLYFLSSWVLLPIPSSTMIKSALRAQPNGQIHQIECHCHHLLPSKANILVTRYPPNSSTLHLGAPARPLPLCSPPGSKMKPIFDNTWQNSLRF